MVPELPPSDRLPSHNFSSASLGAATALAAYQELMKHIFTCAPPPGMAPDEMAPITLYGWHLATLILSCIRAPALTYTRPVELIEASGMDHILVQLYASGGFAGRAGTRPIAVEPGTICVFDLGQTMQTETTDCHIITLVLPRALLEPMLEDVSVVHGLVMDARNPLTSLVAGFMQALVEKAPKIELAQAGNVARATLALVVNAIAEAGISRAGERGGIVSSQFRDILTYIDQHLSEPGLQTETLVEAFGLSRAKLYRLFEDIGGVSNYIRRRRLAAASLYLASPAHKAWRISQIAFACGFSSEENFSRNFKTQFGLTPRDAREQSTDALTAKIWSQPGASPTQEAIIWMKTLRTPQQ
jgi:AraC-like DNA-binding protein